MIKNIIFLIIIEKGKPMGTLLEFFPRIKDRNKIKRIKRLKEKIFYAKLSGMDITLQDIADSLNISRSYLTELLNGTSAVSNEKLKILEKGIKKIIG